MTAQRKPTPSQVEYSSPDDEDKSWPEIEKRSALEQRSDTAHYIASMVTELAQLAANCRLDTLNYLLVMAQMEAEVAARRTTLAKS